jgi:hypothetical protein
MSSYKMQAVSSVDGAIKNWIASFPDFAATGFPGPGSALNVAVLDAQIGDAAVIADGGVITAKLADSAVTAAKLGGASVTADKLDDNAGAFASMADARAVVESLPLGRVVSTLGFATKGDGGGGKRWTVVPIGSLTHNGGTVIAAASSPTKALVRDYTGPIRAIWFGCNASASAATNQAAIQAAINASTTGEVKLPRGLIDHTGAFTLRSNLTLKGHGKLATRLRSSHTGHGLRMSSTVNSSTAVHLELKQLSIENTNPSNAGGAFVDNCGTFIDLVSVRTVGYKFGAVLDQSEIVNIWACDFELPLKAGLWLVNGDEFTTTASIQFTNVINVTGCQFNAGEYGIMDDGGYTHNFVRNNHNGASIAHIRAAGALPCTIKGCEMEVGPVGVLLSALSESGDTAAGAGSYKLDSNIIVVDDYAVSIESAGVIDATNNQFYGEYAFAGMANCSIANGSGNSLLGVAVRTIYQDQPATLHEDWTIPETGTIRQNAFTRGHINATGLPLIWMIGDDRGAITDYVASPSRFETFRNRGAWGGSFEQVGADADRPEISTTYTGKIAPIFGNSGVDAMQLSLPAADLTALHDGTSKITLHVRFRTSDVTTAAQVIFANFNSTVAQIGVQLWIDTGGALKYWVGNGSNSVHAVQLASSAGAIAINTNYLATIVKDGTAIALFIDGVQVDSDTLASPSSSAPSGALQLGSYAGAPQKMVGHIPELLVQQGAQDATQRAIVRTYLNRWS